MAPFVRSQGGAPGLPSRVHSSASLSSRAVSTGNNNSSPGRGGGNLNRNASMSGLDSSLGRGGGGNLNRNASAVSLMSGLGSYTSLFPGQCIPVMLFVFVDDFSSLSNSSTNGEDSSDVSSLNQSSSLSSVGKTNLPA
ncbi:DUF2146 family protein, partial [Trifolium medium]|nr:DUF2146 family protein [Trifolium medium]